MNRNPVDLHREAADADAQADALYEQIEAERMKLPGDVFGTRPFYVEGCEGLFEQARELRVGARDLRADATVSSSVAAGGNVQPAGTPPPPPNSSTAAEAPSTFAPARPQTAQAKDDVETTARRIVNSDAVAVIQSEMDDVGIVALRIASADIGSPDEVDAIAARIAGA